MAFSHERDREREIERKRERHKSPVSALDVWQWAVRGGRGRFVSQRELLARASVATLILLLTACAARSN